MPAPRGRGSPDGGSIEPVDGAPIEEAEPLTGPRLVEAATELG